MCFGGITHAGTKVKKARPRFAMKLRLVAIEATCRTELAAGSRTPSENLQNLARSAGLISDTLAALKAEARTRLEAALAMPFA
jgi:hypothetical protein